MNALPLVTLTCLLLFIVRLGAEVPYYFIQPLTASSEDSLYQLSLKKAGLQRVGGDPQDLIFVATLDVKHKPDAPASTYSWQMAEGVYMDSVEVLEAVLPSGEDISKNQVFTGIENRPARVIIHRLKVGERETPKQLQKLGLAVTFITVTEWETVTFDGIEKIIQKSFPCGPFEMFYQGEFDHVMLSPSATAEFALEREAYRKRVPLNFITGDFALDHTLIEDSKGRHFRSSLRVSTGGAVMGTFYAKEVAIWSPMRLTLDSYRKIPVHYPISIQLKLPKKYHSQRRTFVFSGIHLPMLER